VEPIYKNSNKNFVSFRNIDLDIYVLVNRFFTVTITLPSLKIDTVCLLFLLSDELLRPEECFRIEWRRPH